VGRDRSRARDRGDVDRIAHRVRAHAATRRRMTRVTRCRDAAIGRVIDRAARDRRAIVARAAASAYRSLAGKNLVCATIY
jgi:hypothetical protein